MTVIVIDLETTVSMVDGNKDNSPFNPKNRIVSAHWRMVEDGVIGEAKRAIFYHVEQTGCDDPTELRQDLASADLLVAHNAKFDVMYLLEAGFEIPEKVHCTMVGEYIFARAQNVDKSLKGTAQRRDVTRKRDDLVDELFSKGTGFEEMPLKTVIEYADTDVLSCAEIYLAQRHDLTKESNASLEPVFDLTNEMLLFLVEIERNGIQIDWEELERVERDFIDEKRELEVALNEIVVNCMGDTPINLNSGADMTKVVYSREVVNRDLHKRMFNCGVGPNGKPLPTARMSVSQFANTVKRTTAKVMKTVAEHCHRCDGKGLIQKIKKNGEPWKKQTKCPACGGQGFLLNPTGRIAGLKLIPRGPEDASINGFKTDKATIGKLLVQAKDKDNLIAIEFLTKLTRLNAVSVYLDSFVAGIKTWTRPSGRLHAQFNQTVTRTGRLSSSNPNFQNLPKGNKFPVRKCLISRFDGGNILEIDFSGLEFRVAGELSRDSQIIEDIRGGKDVHKQTASIINQCEVEEVTKDMRQAAKAYTFAPLYGGMGANEPAHVQKYFNEYFNIYQGLAVWHKELMDEVLRTGIVQTPSGRQFYFPNARRLRNGRITNATAVVNYPVQSFATADIVPLSCVRAYKEFKAQGLKSLLVLTVHDSIVCDVYPGEEDAVVKALVWAMERVEEDLILRFGYHPVLPLTTEADIGKNWMETTPISVA